MSESEKFDLLEFARDRKDPSLKTYDELCEIIIKSGKLEELQKELEKNYNPSKTNIVILGTGGTFQSAETDQGRAPSGSLKESFEAMRLPNYLGDFVLSLLELFNYDSSKMETGNHIRFIAEVLIKLLNESSEFFDGVIITHGTDTMTETANYLSLILGRGLKKPIILTGSQTPARKKKSDAVYNMDNCLQVHELIKEKNIGEVMVLCGNELIRGAWTKKISDKSSIAFISFNNNPLIDMSDRLSEAWEINQNILTADYSTPFLPFNEVDQPADTIVIRTADITAQKLAFQIENNRSAIITLLGSSTCPDTHAEIIREASNRGKALILRSAFYDSASKPGDYAAGSILKHSNVPIIKGTESFIKAKINFLWKYFGIKSEHKEGLGEVISKHDQQRLYTGISQNLVGEWF